MKVLFTKSFMRLIIIAGLPIYAQASAAETSWSTQININPMTEKKSAYAISPSIEPNTPMSFPYGDVAGNLVVGCIGNREWVYIIFSTPPNLLSVGTRDGYNIIQTTAKWGNDIGAIFLHQEFGSRSLHLLDADIAIKKISSEKTALIELQWYGQSPRHFNFPLEGAPAALKEIRASCAQI